jgi:hypothetical protein
MATRTIEVSAINHVRDYEDPDLPPFDPRPMDTPKINIGCSILFASTAPQKRFAFAVRDSVSYGEDFTASFDVPDYDPRGIEFFWQEACGGERFRRMAWYDRPREEFGKHWGWVGMFWLFDAVGGTTYERTACGIALTKLTPWPPTAGFRAALANNR